MPWIHAINESAAAEFSEDILNPVRPDKIRTLGKRIRLRPGQRVLDIGAGRCGPARILAREFGVHVTAVEPYEPFLSDARARVDAAGLSARFEFVQSSGADFVIEPERYDAAMCIGASWAFGGHEGTLRALAPGVKRAGHVVTGEGYSVTGDSSFEGQTLQWVLDAFEDAGLAVVSLIRPSDDDYDTYYSVQATSLLDWLEATGEDAEVDGWRREAVNRFAGVNFGWALIAGRKPS
jgi:cyclopropane fatty-acyl-phospholipid synthase-like methyltransferase